MRVDKPSQAERDELNRRIEKQCRAHELLVTVDGSHGKWHRGSLGYKAVIEPPVRWDGPTRRADYARGLPWRRPQRRRRARWWPERSTGSRRHRLWWQERMADHRFTRGRIAFAKTLDARRAGRARMKQRQRRDVANRQRIEAREWREDS